MSSGHPVLKLSILVFKLEKMKHKKLLRQLAWPVRDGSLSRHWERWVSGGWARLPAPQGRLRMRCLGAATWRRKQASRSRRRWLRTSPREASSPADSYNQRDLQLPLESPEANLTNLCCGVGGGEAVWARGQCEAIFQARGVEGDASRRTQKKRGSSTWSGKRSDHVDRWRPWSDGGERVSKQGALHICRQAEGQFLIELEA